MKLDNLILLGALGIGAYFFLSRKTPTTLTSQYWKTADGGTVKLPAEIVGMKACPPGYTMIQGFAGPVCVPYVTSGGAVPPQTSIVKAGQDMVYVNGKLVPISEVFSSGASGGW